MIPKTGHLDRMKNLMSPILEGLVTAKIQNTPKIVDFCVFRLMGRQVE